MEEEEPFDVAEAEAMRREANVFLAPMGIRLPEWPPVLPQAERSVHHPELGVELPWGSLFYPCCGDDLEDALQRFAPYVSDCHFADAYRRPGSRFREERRAGGPRAVEVPHLRRMVLPPAHRVDGYPCPVHLHQRDGLLSFLQDVGPLSVFYYRGDSQGEGGSNQGWLAPLLRDALLARILEGGLIVTDGSNGGDDLAKGPCGTILEHRNRRLTCIKDQLPGRNSRFSMTVWRVTTA